MSEKPAGEADAIKNAETKERSHGALRGGRPVRKRGYHRALKRKESWALFDNMMKEMWSAMNRQLYCDLAYPDKLILGGLSVSGAGPIAVPFAVPFETPENKKP